MHRLFEPRHVSLRTWFEMEELEGRDQPASLSLLVSVPGLPAGVGTPALVQPADSRVNIFGVTSSPFTPAAPPSVVVIVFEPETAATSMSGLAAGAVPSTGLAAFPVPSGDTTPTTTIGTTEGSGESVVVPTVVVVNVPTLAGGFVAGRILGDTGAETGSKDTGAPRFEATDPNAGLTPPKEAPHQNTLGGWGSEAPVNPEEIGGTPRKGAAPIEVAPPPHEPKRAEPAPVLPIETAATINPLLVLTTVSTVSTVAPEASALAPAANADEAAAAPAPATPENPAGSRWSWFAAATAVMVGMYWAVRRTLLVRKLSARVKPIPASRFFGPLYSIDVSGTRA